MWEGLTLAPSSLPSTLSPRPEVPAPRARPRRESEEGEGPFGRLPPARCQRRRTASLPDLQKLRSIPPPPAPAPPLLRPTILQPLWRPHGRTHPPRTGLPTDASVPASRPHPSPGHPLACHRSPSVTTSTRTPSLPSTATACTTLTGSRRTPCCACPPTCAVSGAGEPGRRRWWACTVPLPLAAAAHHLASTEALAGRRTSNRCCGERHTASMQCKAQP